MNHVHVSYAKDPAIGPENPALGPILLHIGRGVSGFLGQQTHHHGRALRVRRLDIYDIVYNDRMEVWHIYPTFTMKFNQCRYTWSIYGYLYRHISTYTQFTTIATPFHPLPGFPPLLISSLRALRARNLLPKRSASDVLGRCGPREC